MPVAKPSRDQQSMTNVDVLRTPLVFTLPGGHTMGQELDQLIKKALDLFKKTGTNFHFDPSTGLIAQLEELAGLEEDPSRKGRISQTARLLKAHFSLSDPDKQDANDGLVRILTSQDKLMTFLTVTPPRGNANLPTTNMVNSDLERAKIVYGTDTAAIEDALRVVRDTHDIIWRKPVGQGDTPVPARYGDIRYRVKVIDKSSLAENREELTALNDLWAPLEPDDIIGIVDEPDAGSPGKDVFGREILPPEENTRLDIGRNIVFMSNGALIARAPGYVIVDKQHIDIAPLYVIQNPDAGSVDDFFFPGTVLIQGNLIGPGSLKCNDLFVTGKCEQMSAVLKGDMFVRDGVIGHHEATIDTDGRVYAKFISETTIFALGQIVASTAIVNSHVISNDVIRVTSERGMIAGGNLFSMREIMAATIGSEFGMLTEAGVGKDFLTPTRLKDITDQIVAHEENLRKIKQLKDQLGKSRVPIEKMPPAKQEVFISILKKEQSSQEELDQLMKRKRALSTTLHGFIPGCVQAFDSLYPPLKVQIGDHVEQISDPLGPVTLRYDKARGIVTDSSNNENREEENASS